MLPFIKEAIGQLISKPSTEGYPFVPKEAPLGYRGRIVFHADKCINCGICERVCAAGTITTTSIEKEDGFEITRRFALDSCAFCANCAEFCPTKSIELSQDYHMIARSSDDLVVAGTYFKKKPTPKAVPAPKPASELASIAKDEQTATKALQPRDDGKPVLDASNCIYCGLCAKNCPVEAISVDRAAKSWVLDEEKCIACGNCAKVCPKKTIII